MAPVEGSRCDWFDFLSYTSIKNQNFGKLKLLREARTYVPRVDRASRRSCQLPIFQLSSHAVSTSDMSATGPLAILEDQFQGPDSKTCFSFFNRSITAISTFNVCAAISGGVNASHCVSEMSATRSDL